MNAAFRSQPERRIYAAGRGLSPHISRPKSGTGLARLRSAGFQPAVSPTSSRQAVAAWPHLRIGNPRYSRLEACATRPSWRHSWDIRARRNRAPERGQSRIFTCFAHSPAAEPISRVTSCADLKSAGNARGDPDDVEAQSTASLDPRWAGIPSTSGPDRPPRFEAPAKSPSPREAGTRETAGLTPFRLVEVGNEADHG